MLIGRFILRFLLVPLGIAVAALVGIAVVMIGEWNAFLAFLNERPDTAGDYFFVAMIAAPYLFITLAGAALTMLAPGAIGILVAEFFAIRSWIFHIANGAISA